MSTDSANTVLVLFAHPAFQCSRVNRALAAAAEAVDGVTFHDLYESYCCSGKNQFTVRDLLAPFQQTAALCGMTFLPPFVI